MKKSILFKVSENTPLILNNLAQWLKNYFPGYAQDILINSAGTTGILLRLISQPLIEKYFRGLTHSRLANSGNQTYLEAALKQAVQSLANIENEVQSSASPEEVVRQFQQIAIKKFENTNNENLLPILQTQYHPIVIHVKESYVHILKSLSVDEVIIHSFRQHFNRHIEEEVRKTFGRDYGAHQAMIKDNILEERITRLLYETTLLSQIGFEEDENLKYETTYGYWKPLAEYGKEDSLITRMSLGTDRNVRPVTRLIDDYFNIDPDNHLSKILFLIADFGKGKSVFLKNYAAELAKKYLIENEGLFPIYFNLRNYNKYDPKVPLGVIGDYLLTEYGIKIDAPAHKHRKYIFLIDSLDEIGELNKEMVSGMIRIVKKIQHLDKELARTNRLIIASRPIANGLKENISFYKPYHFSPLKSTEYFITLYGFKKDQFNDWMHTTLKGFLSNIKNSSIPLLAAIHDSIQNDIPYDLYTKLLSDSTLNEEELRRPIFAYMVYQLMIRNMDILQLGRIGIYLSFLNLLTKEAKHIRDPHYKVSLQKEFEFRNLLHATALLWEYKRNTGQQSALNKADICRILDGEKKYNKEETNQEVLERYRQQGITDIQFLSHSYFGEENNLLYFQHQSFAEMLLAEYYLKIFLKFALEEKTDLQQARIHMSLGTPTPQTIQFLIGLLKLLSETATKKVTSTIIEKRKLLFPILASMATDNNNILFSARTYEEWYVHGNFPAGTTEYPLELLEKWYIDPGKIEKILFFC